MPIAAPSKWVLFSPGGLSNRLKVLVSGRVLAAHAGAQLEVLWPLRATCNCPYERLFEPDATVRTVPEQVTDELPRRIGWNVPPPDLLTHVGPIVLGHMSWLVRPDLYPRHEALWSELAPGLDALVPTAAIRERVAAFTGEHFRDHMIGVHLRRGDFHFARPDVSANTDAALRAIDDHLARVPSAAIFLATDDGAVAGPGAESVQNEGVRARLQRRYGDRVVTTTPRSLDRNDPIAIEDALVDLLLLRKTHAIVGTSASSFSELAAFGRDVTLDLAAGQSPLIAQRERLVRRVGLYPVLMGLARLRLGRPAHTFFEAWHTVRYSPLGDRIISAIRPYLPKKL